jgi:hypothetical protein
MPSLPLVALLLPWGDGVAGWHGVYASPLPKGAGLQTPLPQDASLIGYLSRCSPECGKAIQGFHNCAPAPVLHASFELLVRLFDLRSRRMRTRDPRGAHSSNLTSKRGFRCSPKRTCRSEPPLPPPLRSPVRCSLARSQMWGWC